MRDITDDFTAGIDTTGTVEVGGLAKGAIEPIGDKDWFAVSLEAGKTYDVDLLRVFQDTSDGNALWDPYLYGVRDAAGNLIEGTTSADGTDLGLLSRALHERRVKFSPTESGKFYVAVAAKVIRVRRLLADGQRRRR